MTHIEEALNLTPRCLEGLVAQDRTITVHAAEHYSTSFAIACSCGSHSGALCGYPLANINTEYPGTAFVGPLSFHCVGCGRSARFFDSELHGYHGELGTSAKRHGSGPPHTYSCPQCSASAFTVSLQFAYLGGALDLLADEPDIAVQNYFQRLIVTAKCQACRASSTVTDMEL